MSRESGSSKTAVTEAAVVKPAAFWATRACGSRHSQRPAKTAEFYSDMDAFRYGTEPVEAFARFAESFGRVVLEIGTGAGGDLSRYVRHGAQAVGIDLSPRAVDVAAGRLRLGGLPIVLARADALALPFKDATFELIWSWGVLHHTRDIRGALDEALRVLRPGGEVRLMLYHRPSWVAVAAWVRWALLRGRPFQGLKRVVAHHVESPGTLALTESEIREVMGRFEDVQVEIVGSYWDRKFMPLLGRLAGNRLGWFALVRARKPS